MNILLSLQDVHDSVQGGVRASKWLDLGVLRSLSRFRTTGKGSTISAEPRHTIPVPLKISEQT
jgi:hypothetical protein